MQVRDVPFFGVPFSSKPGLHHDCLHFAVFMDFILRCITHVSRNMAMHLNLQRRTVGLSDIIKSFLCSMKLGHFYKYILIKCMIFFYPYFLNKKIRDMETFIINLFIVAEWKRLLSCTVYR